MNDVCSSVQNVFHFLTKPGEIRSKNRGRDPLVIINLYHGLQYTSAYGVARTEYAILLKFLFFELKRRPEEANLLLLAAMLLIRSSLLMFRRHVLLGMAACLCVTGVSPETGPTLAEQEWRTHTEDSPAGISVPEHCSGAYYRPDYPEEPAGGHAQLPVHATAGSLTWWENGKTVLRQGVMLEQGNTSLETDKATYFELERKVELPSVVTLREPGVVMRGQRGEVNIGDKTARLENAEIVLPEDEFRGISDLIERNESGDLSLTHSVFTRCEPGNNNWSLKSKSLLIEKDSNFAVARNAVLKVGPVPVFYTPYIKFPINDERQSGFLFPSVGYSGEDGLDLTIPYYLNLAPDYDALVAPRVITNRGLGLETEFRYLNTWSNSEFSGALLHKDSLFNGELSKKDFLALNPTEEFDKADRWLVGANHRGRLGRFTTIVDYKRVSDDEYFRDLGSNLGVSSQVQLERRAELRYRLAGLSARFWAQGFQNLDSLRPGAYQRLPELELAWQKNLGAAKFSISGEWANFDRKNSNFIGLDKIVGDRLHIEPRIELPLYWRAGFMKFAAAYKYTSYKLEDTPDGFDSSPRRNLGMASADGGLYFDRTVKLFGMDLLQTLEPRVFYLYQGYENQDMLPRFDSSALTFGYSQLYRDNRFTGLDRLGDANQLSVGLTTRFMDLASGKEYLRASLGRVRYFKDRRVSLNTVENSPDNPDNLESSSALAGELSANLGRRYRMGAALVWDTKNSEIDESNFYLQYKNGERRLINLAYRSRDLSTNISQLDVSAYWAVGKRWNLIGRYNYDLEFNRTIETFGGLEYNDCCWRLRILVRQYIDNPSNRSIEDLDTDTGIFLQVVFKGLAGFGSKIDNIMENGIRGFQRRP